jgi:secreted PhoX family phosphatase
MALFRDGGKNILTVNNEYVNRSVIYGNRASKLPENADDIRKGKAGHGVSVLEIKMQEGKWTVVKDSPLNRRITADTPMEITGPARGHDLLWTTVDPSGTQSKGTWGNCGNGRTPWGTYLACEENFNGYFSSSDDTFEPNAAQTRYGIGKKDWGYAWAKADERFDVSKHPNEPNRVGYIVEIDPMDPTSIPKKRTALGRIKHENAEVVIANSDGLLSIWAMMSAANSSTNLSATANMSKAATIATCLKMAASSSPNSKMICAALGWN